jgi:hypothetical protein
VVGIAVSEQFELVFDTLGSTRKAINLKANPQVAFVIGGWVPGDERTVQYEGVVAFPAGEELERVKRVYFQAFPEGVERQAWAGITYAVVKPRWIRVSDFNANPPVVSERVYGSQQARGGSAP